VVALAVVVVVVVAPVVVRRHPFRSRRWHHPLRRLLQRRLRLRQPRQPRQRRRRPPTPRRRQPRQRRRRLPAPRRRHLLRAPRQLHPPLRIPQQRRSTRGRQPLQPSRRFRRNGISASFPSPGSILAAKCCWGCSCFFWASASGGSLGGPKARQGRVDARGNVGDTRNTNSGAWRSGRRARTWRRIRRGKYPFTTRSTKNNVTEPDPTW